MFEMSNFGTREKYRNTEKRIGCLFGAFIAYSFVSSAMLIQINYDLVIHNKIPEKDEGFVTNLIVHNSMLFMIIFSLGLVLIYQLRTKYYFEYKN